MLYKLSEVSHESIAVLQHMSDQASQSQENVQFKGFSRSNFNVQSTLCQVWPHLTNISSEQAEMSNIQRHTFMSV